MSIKSHFRSALLALAGVALATSASAVERERSTPREARALFDQAVHYFEANGPERSFAAFNNQKGHFVHKDLYVFVIDQKGTYHASGAAPEALVGMNVIDTRDAAGTPLFRNMIEAVQTEPEARVRYVWLNRVTNKVEPKVSFVRKEGDYVVGVGYFVPRSTAEDAQRFMNAAAAYAHANGARKAAKVFNDPMGTFRHDDLYVFMVNLDTGKFEAMGINPKLTGTDAMALHDVEGRSIIKDMIDIAKKQDEGSYEYVWRNPVTNAVEKKHTFIRREGNSLVGVGYYLEQE